MFLWPNQSSFLLHSRLIGWLVGVGFLCGFDLWWGFVCFGWFVRVAWLVGFVVFLVLQWFWFCLFGWGNRGEAKKVFAGIL